MRAHAHGPWLRFLSICAVPPCLLGVSRLQYTGAPVTIAPVLRAATSTRMAALAPPWAGRRLPFFAKNAIGERGVHVPEGASETLRVCVRGITVAPRVGLLLTVGRGRARRPTAVAPLVRDSIMRYLRFVRQRSFGHFRNDPCFDPYWVETLLLPAEEG